MRCEDGWGRPGWRGSATGSPSNGWWPGPPRCTHAWPAEATQRALTIRLRLIEPARVHHAEVTEREIVFHRVRRIETAQGCRDIPGHLPARAGVARQAEAAPDADDVRVERDDQLRGRHTGPHAEIERILAHHPAQKQIETLAAAARRWPWKKIADAGSAAHTRPAVRSREIECER